VTATPSTVTSSSAAFGRWAFVIGQPRRDRRGRMDIVKGRSAQSDASAWTMLSWSGSGISAICFALTRPTTIRLGRTCRSTRMRRRREQYIPLVAFCLRHFLAAFIICTCEFDFRQAQGRLSWRPPSLPALKRSNCFKNYRRLDHKNLCFREHIPWPRRHISNHGWNRTRSENPTRRGGHLVEFALMHLRL
jgi:hypothetical protein